jgi:hypothetical protein
LVPGVHRADYADIAYGIENYGNDNLVFGGKPPRTMFRFWFIWSGDDLLFRVTKGTYKDHSCPKQFVNPR